MTQQTRFAASALLVVASVLMGRAASAFKEHSQASSQSKELSKPQTVPRAVPTSQKVPDPSQKATDGAEPAGTNNAAGMRNFLGLGTMPDAEAAKRGAPIYAANCSFCHGSTARGAEGPSMLTSDVVLGDDHGEKMVPFLQQGRPDKGMPSFARLSNMQLKDVTEFLHLQVEQSANRGAYKVANILLGNPQDGEAYFQAHCSTCHSVSNDLAHIGSKYKPTDLQRNWISPPRNNVRRRVTATITRGNDTVTGFLTQLDDFHLTVKDSAGQVRAFDRDAGVRVAEKDPLASHMNMIPSLKDSDIHNVTAYLERQK